jgi:hypothetical protein|tara:strand:- start:24893 stop:25099 length:207 start_codon:yes stop_codon:yes gene_type:complete
MAQYNSIKDFCNRVIHIQKTGSKEVRLTQEEAISLMCELNQLLLNQQQKIDIPTVKRNTESSVDAGVF